MPPPVKPASSSRRGRTLHPRPFFVDRPAAPRRRGRPAHPRRPRPRGAQGGGAVRPALLSVSFVLVATALPLRAADASPTRAYRDHLAAVCAAGGECETPE